MSALVYRDINNIDTEKTYQGYMFSEFCKNHISQDILQALCDQLECTIEWFAKEKTPHITWQFHNHIIWKDLVSLYTEITEKLWTINLSYDIFHKNTLHKSHMRDSFVNKEKHLLLIPHEDSDFYDIVTEWATPHISLGTYRWKLADGKILATLRTIKDNIFSQYKDTQVIHIMPNPTIAIKYKAI